MRRFFVWLGFLPAKPIPYTHAPAGFSFRCLRCNDVWYQEHRPVLIHRLTENGELAAPRPNYLCDECAVAAGILGSASQSVKWIKKG